MLTIIALQSKLRLIQLCSLEPMLKPIIKLKILLIKQIPMFEQQQVEPKLKSTPKIFLLFLVYLQSKMSRFMQVVYIKLSKVA